MEYQYNDGGRVAAGFLNDARRDCVVRAIAIFTDMDYRDVWNRLAIVHKQDGGRTRSADTGIYTDRANFIKYTAEVGLVYTILTKRETLRYFAARYKRDCIVQVRKHVIPIIGGVMHDTQPQGLNTIVKGFWQKATPIVAPRLFEVYKGDVKMSRYPMSAEAAANMVRLFELNYKSTLNIKAYVI